MRKLFISVIVFTLLILVSSNSFAQLKAKSPGTATALSVFLPGAGHMYAGDPIGIKMLGVYAGAMGLVIAYGPWNWEEEKKSELFPELAEGTGTSTTTKLIWYASAGVAAVTWLYAVLDSGPAVKRYNKRMNLSILPSYQKDNMSLSLMATVNF